MLEFLDSNREVIGMVYSYGNVVSVLDRELSAMRLALMKAKKRVWERVIVEFDAEISVKALSHGKGPPKWQADKTFYEVEQAMEQLEAVEFTFIPRNVNREGHNPRPLFVASMFDQ